LKKKKRGKRKKKEDDKIIIIKKDEEEARCSSNWVIPNQKNKISKLKISKFSTLSLQGMLEEYISY
jgi:hypothetical protein